MSFVRASILLITAVACSFLGLGCASAPAAHESVGPLQELRAGNDRFQSGKARHPHQDARLRHDLAEHGQHPFATVIACSDSRVPVELIFDQGIGDLFVIRVAGNVLGSDETGSIEYAVEHLHCPLVVVLGHKQCGAVAAAVKHVSDTPSIMVVLRRIEPAVRQARKKHPNLEGDALVAEAVKENVWQSMADLIGQSQYISQSVADGSVSVIGAVYDIDSGAIEWLGRHPQEEAIRGAWVASRVSRTGA